MSSFNSKLTKLILAEVEAAFLKAATPVEGEVFPEFATAEEARDEFRDRFLADLAERLGVATKTKTKKTKQEDTVTVPITDAAQAQEVAPVKERKARSPMTPEKKAAMKAKRDATLAAKKAEAAPEEAAPAPAAAPAAESPKEKKKRGPMTEEAKAAMKAKRDATLAAKKADSPVAEEKPKAAKKAKVSEDANLAKVDPTWRKHLKTAAKAAGKEASKEMEAALLTHLNGLTKEEFNAKKAEEHVSAFLAAPVAAAADAPEVAKVPANLEVVEFEGKDYYVNPETKRVYEGEGEEDPETGGWTNYKPVGYVGMAAFTEMTLE
jgi:RNA polymerase primary sigma factor